MLHHSDIALLNASAVLVNKGKAFAMFKHWPIPIRNVFVFKRALIHRIHDTTNVHTFIGDTNQYVYVRPQRDDTPACDMAYRLQHNVDGALNSRTWTQYYDTYKMYMERYADVMDRVTKYVQKRSDAIYRGGILHLYRKNAVEYHGHGVTLCRMRATVYTIHAM